MAKQSFKNTISFLIANGDCDTVESIQWHGNSFAQRQGSEEVLAETLIEIASNDMIFMGTQFSFDKDGSDTAIVIANIIIRMLQGKWEYEVSFNVDPDLTISRLNQAKKLIRNGFDGE